MGRGRAKTIIALDRGDLLRPASGSGCWSTARRRKGLSKINVDYEELPAAIEVEEAMADGAPLVHSFAEKNLCFQTELVKGDVEKGFAESDEIVEDIFEFPMIYHYSMEPHTCIAQVDSDGITIWASTGHPFCVRQEVAEFFKVPLSKVRVHTNFVGAAYGINPAQRSSRWSSRWPVKGAACSGRSNLAAHGDLSPARN
jgi:CO/xanthine dehydrogenase Mo-binding subunit